MTAAKKNEAMFTPGPWAIVGHSWNKTGIYSAQRRPIALLSVSSADEESYEADEAQMTADAHLIAAAPDLLEALQLALPRMAHSAKCGRVLPTEEWGAQGSMSFDNCQCEIKTVRAAIAKATS